MKSRAARYDVPFRLISSLLWFDDGAKPTFQPRVSSSKLLAVTVIFAPAGHNSTVYELRSTSIGVSNTSISASKHRNGTMRTKAPRVGRNPVLLTHKHRYSHGRTRSAWAMQCLAPNEELDDGRRFVLVLGRAERH